MNLKMDETHAVKYIKGARHILPHGAGNGKRGLQEARVTDKLCHYITWKRRYFRKAGGFPKRTRAAHRTARFRVAARLPHKMDFVNRRILIVRIADARAERSARGMRVAQHLEHIERIQLAVFAAVLGGSHREPELRLVHFRLEPVIRLRFR